MDKNTNKNRHTGEVICEDALADMKRLAEEEAAK